MRFVVGQNRSQSTLFPELLDEYIGDDNPVRAIDVLSTSFSWAISASTVFNRTPQAGQATIPRRC
jgi:hypothetical protein